MSKKVKFEGILIGKKVGYDHVYDEECVRVEFVGVTDGALNTQTIQPGNRYRVTMKPVAPEEGEEPKLKPCPFCGATGPDLSVFDKGYGYVVGCHKCGCGGPAAAWLQAAKASWNQRE